MRLRKKKLLKVIFWGLLIHQKSETRYKSRQNGSWKPAQKTKLDFQKFDSPPRVKVSGWDLGGGIQVTSLGRKSVWKGKLCWYYFFVGLLIHQNSDTRYIPRQNGSWKPAQKTKLDFQKFDSPPRVKFLGWDLDGRSQVTSLGRNWVWKGKLCWN